MALTPDGWKALLHYIAQVAESGTPHKATIREAILLTDKQQAEISAVLKEFWGAREYRCPRLLDLKPQHGYQSRVTKDHFSAEDYAEWLAVGCSDVAKVGRDSRGRPHLYVEKVRQGEARDSYDVLIPIRSTAEGHVHVDDVIPKGLKGQ